MSYFPEDPNHPLDGLDVSQWQKSVDYRQFARDGGEFVIIKHSGANTGKLYLASRHAEHLAGARAAGLAIGHYYVVNGHMSILDQAKFFVDNLKKVIKPGEIAVLDNESLDKGIAFTPEQVLLWMAYVEENLNLTPVFYSYPALMRRQNLTQVAKKYPLWLAAFNKNNGTTEGGWQKHMVGLPWKEPAIWQYTSQGRIDGYNAPIDRNIAKRDVFSLYGHKGPVAPPPPSSGELPLTKIDGIPGPATWKRLQTFLKKEWGYTGPIDGIPGTNTWKAMQRFANSIDTP